VYSWTKVRLDETSSVPLFEQIASWIRNAITKEVLKQSERIPNEVELCRIFNVSRITVRNALLKLENSGFIERKRAKGTYVLSRGVDFQYISESMGLGEELVKKGVPIEDEVLRCEVIEADVLLSDKLGIKVGDKVFALERLRLIHNEPLILSCNFLDYSMVTGIEKYDFTKNFLYSVLEKDFSMRLGDFVRTFEPIILDETQTRLFRLKRGQHLAFKIESITYDIDNRVVEYYEGIQRGRYGKLTVRSKRTSDFSGEELI
jgi:GntR family transcriptional regulator